MPSAFRTWANVLRGVAALGDQAAERLEKVDLRTLPGSALKQVETLWANQAAFVEGVRELVSGFEVMQQHLANVSAQVVALDARIGTLETQLSVMKRGRRTPLHPSGVFGGDVCLEEASPDSSEPSERV